MCAARPVVPRHTDLLLKGESDDAKAIYLGLAPWTDVLDLKITPCVEDADASAALASLGKR